MLEEQSKELELKPTKASEDTKRIPNERSLLEFIERQILELEEELECPVCLEVATTAPIYKCLDDHLICRFTKHIHLITVSQIYAPILMQNLPATTIRVPSMQGCF